MAVSSFKDVNWGDEPIDATKLNTMASNTRFLFERAPKLLYNAYAVKKDTGVKLACGVATIVPKKTSWHYVNVNFGSFFTTGSRPVITTSITAGYNSKIVPTLYGLSGVAYVPDYRGFQCRIVTFEPAGKDNYIGHTSYLNWIAMGY